jgi:hypothetical protein
MDADFDDLHPDMQRRMKKNRKWMKTHSPRPKRIPLTPPSGYEEYYDEAGIDEYWK